MQPRPTLQSGGSIRSGTFWRDSKGDPTTGDMRLQNYLKDGHISDNRKPAFFPLAEERLALHISENRIIKTAKAQTGRKQYEVGNTYGAR
ncbi:hypothetical protein Trydic_g6411 [Trypoxylus dichotomus]